MNGLQWNFIELPWGGKHLEFQMVSPSFQFVIPGGSNNFCGVIDTLVDQNGIKKKNKWLNFDGMLTAQSKIRPLLNKLWSDFDDIFRIAQQWYLEQLIKFWGDLDYHADSPNP